MTASALLAVWRALCPATASSSKIVCHGGPDGTSGSRNHAARMLALADECGIPAIPVAAVRAHRPGRRAIVDVLDAARRLVTHSTAATSTGSPGPATSRPPDDAPIAP